MLFEDVLQKFKWPCLLRCLITFHRINRKDAWTYRIKYSGSAVSKLETLWWSEVQFFIIWIGDSRNFSIHLHLFTEYYKHFHNFLLFVLKIQLFQFPSRNSPTSLRDVRPLRVEPGLVGHVPHRVGHPVRPRPRVLPADGGTAVRAGRARPDPVARFERIAERSVRVDLLGLLHDGGRPVVRRGPCHGQSGQQEGGQDLRGEKRGLKS